MTDGEGSASDEPATGTEAPATSRTEGAAKAHGVRRAAAREAPATSRTRREEEAQRTTSPPPARRGKRQRRAARRERPKRSGGQSRPSKRYGRDMTTTAPQRPATLGQ